MTEERESRYNTFAIALIVVLMAAVAVDWSPRYWAVAVAVGGVCLLTAAWAIAAPGFAIEPRQIPPAVAVALIGVWGLVQLAAHITIAPWLTARVSLNRLASGAAFFLGSQILCKPRARRIFLSGILWCGGFFAVIAILQMYVEPVRVYGIFPADYAIVGTFLYRNQFAAMMELVAPIALWHTLEGRESSVTGGLIFTVIFASVVASASRAGVILMLAEVMVALGLMVFLWKLPLKTAGSLLGILVLLLTAAALIGGTERITNRFHEKNQYLSRPQLMQSTIRMTAERPWLGWGMGTWRIVYPRFATFDDALLANEAHNDWVQWASEGGIPFSLLMAALVIWVAKPSLQSIWGLGVLVVMIHSLVDYVTREPAVGLIWFAMAGAVSRFEPFYP